MWQAPPSVILEAPVGNNLVMDAYTAIVTERDTRQFSPDPVDDSDRWSD